MTGLGRAPPSRLGLPVQVALVLLGLGIAFAAVTAWWAIHPQATTPSCDALECGGLSLAIGNPTESNVSGNWVYNFSIQAAGGGLTLSGLTFQVQDSSGHNLTPSSSWTLIALDTTKSVIGSFSWTTSSWSSGGDGFVRATDVLSLSTGTTNVSGDVFLVIGTGASHGAVSVSIL
jgi:hypothetical protein